MQPFSFLNMARMYFLLKNLWAHKIIHEKKNL